MEKATKYPRGDIASSQRLRKSPQQDGRSPLRVNGSGQIIQSSSNPNLLQVAAVRARSTLWPTELSETRAFPPKKKTIIRDQCALTASLAKRAGFCVWDAFAGGASTQPTFGLEKKRKERGALGCGGRILQSYTCWQGILSLPVGALNHTRLDFLSASLTDLA